MTSATDVTDETFEDAVLGRSTETTVIVDLWASWCGPCKTLGPILEKVVDEADGVELVKIDVDSNPRSAATFQVQSIPAVYAIRDRKVVDSFIGALSEPAVRQWVSNVTPKLTEVDLLIGKGDEQSLRSALELEPANPKAVLGLAAILSAPGEGQERRTEALALLRRVPETAESRHIAAQARLGDEVAAATGGDPARSDDSIEAKLDGLLETVKDDESARQEFVDLLEILGPDDPRTAAYRKALTARLF